MDTNGLEFTGKTKFVIAGLARHDDEYGQQHAEFSLRSTDGLRYTHYCAILG